tara:strand:- start:4099 stop:5310 length:1212 start_codon:yes stop_codon:yes gene_type:complete
MLKPLFVTNTARCGSGLIARMLTSGNEANIVAEAHLDLFRSLRNSIVKYASEPELTSRPLEQSPFFDYFFSPEHQKIMRCVQACPSIDIPLKENEWERMLIPLVKRAKIENRDMIPVYSHSKADNYRECFLKQIENIAAARKLDKTKIKWVGIKDSWIIELFLPLARTFPDAKFIVIIRDPRASISSNQLVQNPKMIAHVLSFAKSWRKHLAFATHYKNHPEIDKRLHIVTFEQFVTHPEEKSRELCDFLEIEFKPSMLDTDTYIDYSTGTTWRGNSNYEETTRGISVHRIDRWRKKLPPEMVRTIELVCAPDMKLIGREPLTQQNQFWPNTEILEFLLSESLNSKAWRNDFGRLEMDYGFELVRKSLIDSDRKFSDKKLIESAFLFEEVYDALRTPSIQPIF